MTQHTKMASIAENGRLVIPLDMRRALGMDKGGKVLLRIEKDSIIVETVDAAVARVQALARQYGSPGRSLVDELIAERRQEAMNE